MSTVIDTCLSSGGDDVGIQRSCHTGAAAASAAGDCGYQHFSVGGCDGKPLDLFGGNRRNSGAVFIDNIFFGNAVVDLGVKTGSGIAALLRLAPNNRGGILIAARIDRSALTYICFCRTQQCRNRQGATHTSLAAASRAACHKHRSHVVFGIDKHVAIRIHPGVFTHISLNVINHYADRNCAAHACLAATSKTSGGGSEDFRRIGI